MPKTTIKVERARHKLTQNDLAEAVGTSRQTVHAIESGKNECPSVLTIMKIAKFFGITVEDLYEDT